MTMLLEVLIALQAAAGAAPPAAPGLEPVSCTAEEMAARFPAAWRLPRTDRANNPLANAQFEESLIRLAGEPLLAADAAAGRKALMLGDLLARATAAARAGSLPAARKSLDSLLAEAQAIVPAARWPQVEALLDLRDFVSPRWDPDDADERDGFLLGPTWNLPADCWPQHEGGRAVEQCAVFMAADLASIKACESDFARTLRYPGSSYLAAAPTPGSYFVSDPAAVPRSASGLVCAESTALTVDFRNDLPFPFGTYEFRLRCLTALDEQNRPRTWVYSDSEAFHWLAGCDLFEPVYDGAGGFVGMLIVRQTGADLDGVPDRSSHRQAGMRVSLGGLRREAEAHFLARAGLEPFPPRGAVPVCPVPAAAAPR